MTMRRMRRMVPKPIYMTNAFLWRGLDGQPTAVGICGESLLLKTETCNSFPE
jgi:hypothetical protein